MSRTLLLLFVASASSGCSSLEQVSSGHVGCAPAEITISDESHSIAGHTWTATCAQQRYHCSTHGGGDGNAPQVACTAAGGKVPGGASAVAPEPPAQTGCAHDQHCKGDRICSDGSCVDPPAAAPAPEPDDSTDLDGGPAPEAPKPSA